MNKLVDVIIKVLIYSILFAGIWFSVGRYVKGALKRNRYSNRLNNRNKYKKDSKFTTHISLLIFLTLNKKGKNYVYIFILLSIILFFISFYIFFSLFGASIFFILISAFLGMLPYIVLRLRFSNLQLEGSYEAETLIAELNNMYKISSLNMAEAIDKTIDSLKDCPHSRRAMFHLSIAIRQYRSKDELQSAVDSFVASTGTEWARILGTSIFESIAGGTNVSIALDGILSELKEIKSIIEKDKRANNEAFTMVKFVIPVVYILSIYAAVKFFGFTISKFFYYQFSTALGIKFFITIIALSILSYGAMFILKKPKFDY